MARFVAEDTVAVSAEAASTHPVQCGALKKGGLVVLKLIHINNGFMSLMDDTTGVVRHDVRLPPVDTEIGKEILEKFTTQQDFIHYVQLVEAMDKEAVVAIKSCE